MVSARLFIRNDDVWTLDERFRFFFDQSLARGIPVVHAVIPGKIDSEAIRFLCRAKEKTPHLLDIVQHGWIHANHSLEAGKKYEFGPSRDEEVQKQDIQQGLTKMQEAFGEYFTSAFVPPYHGYDERTIERLTQEGFQIFSAGTSPVVGKKNFIEMPAQVSLTQYDQGKKSIRDAKELITHLAKEIVRQPLTGILTHHADFNSEDSRQQLIKFFDWLSHGQAKEKWQMLLFSDILSAVQRIEERVS